MSSPHSRTSKQAPKIIFALVYCYEGPSRHLHTLGPVNKHRNNFCLCWLVQARGSKQTFLVLTAWKKLNFYFYTNGPMETNNSNDAIEFSIKKYLYNQIFKNGNQKSPAIVSSHGGQPNLPRLECFFRSCFRGSTIILYY